MISYTIKLHQIELTSSFSTVGLPIGVPVPIPNPPKAFGNPNPVPGLGTSPAEKLILADLDLSHG